MRNDTEVPDPITEGRFSCYNERTVPLLQIDDKLTGGIITL